MNTASGLYSIRMAVGLLSVVLVSSACRPANAQHADRSWMEGMFGTNGAEYRIATSDAEVDRYFHPTVEEGMDGYFCLVGHDACNTCCEPFCDNPCPCVYGQVEAMFLMRHPRFSRQPIVVDQNTNTTLLSTSDLDYNYDPGMRATFGKRLCGGRALEFTYFGLFDGSASASSSDANAFLTFQNNLVGNVFVDMDRVDVDYSSWLHSFEANFPCCCGCCDLPGCGDCGDQGCGDSGCGNQGNGFGTCQSLEWFCGFRYLNLGERLNISAQRTVNNAVESGSYNLRTNNNLYGLQIGGRMRRTQGRIGWEAGGKAGIFGNDSRQSQSVTDFPDFALRPAVSNSSGTVAFVGETNLTALYRLTNVWNLRAGYNVMWIEGVALAPDQLDFDFAAAQGGSGLRNDGGMLLHGVSFGVEARY